jgi:hypothetical protein
VQIESSGVTVGASFLEFSKRRYLNHYSGFCSFRFTLAKYRIFHTRFSCADTMNTFSFLSDCNKSLLSGRKQQEWRLLKVKVKLSLCFLYNWAPRHEGVLGEWKCSSAHSLTSALDRSEWSFSRPGRFTPRGRAPGTHWIGGWVGSRTVLDAVVKRKISSLRRGSKRRTPIIQPVA